MNVGAAVSSVQLVSSNNPLSAPSHGALICNDAVRSSTATVGSSAASVGSSAASIGSSTATA